MLETRTTSWTTCEAATSEGRSRPSRGCSAAEQTPTSGWFSQSPDKSNITDIHYSNVRTHPHGLWILVSEQSEERSEAAETGREQDEEGELLLRVHGHLVEGGQQLSVRTL